MQTLSMTASANFPIYVALGLFSNEIIAALYGPQWKESAIYLQILAGWGLFRSVGNPVGSLLHAVGAVRKAFWWNAVSVVVTPTIYYTTASIWGLQGLSISMIAICIFQVPLMWGLLVRPYCGATLGEYLGQLSIPFLLSAISGIFAWSLTHNLEHGTIRLSVGCFLGGTAYLLLSRVFNRQWFNAVWTLLGLSSAKSA
jgi:O-antigen/teichoic acid export membrane protein